MPGREGSLLENALNMHGSPTHIWRSWWPHPPHAVGRGESSQSAAGPRYRQSPAAYRGKQDRSRCPCQTQAKRPPTIAQLSGIKGREGSLAAPDPSDEPTSVFRRKAEPLNSQFRAVPVTQTGQKPLSTFGRSMTQTGQKQWDGLLLPRTASRCQTGIDYFQWSGRRSPL